MTTFLQLRSSTSGAPFVGVNQNDSVLWDTVERAWYVGPGGGAGAVSSVFGRVGAVVAATGDYDGDQIDNVSTVAGATISDALETLALSAGAVASVFSRTGVVVAQANDYAASQVNNDSSVTGATVKAALNALLGAIPVLPVSSVFSRVGAVVATLNDYAASLVSNNSTVVGATVKDALNTIDTFLDALAASQVANDSTVSGATVKAALETLAATGGAVSSVFGRVGAIVAAANDYAASQVSNDSSVTGATVKAALDALLGAIPSIPVSSVFGRIGAVVAAANDYAASQINNDSSVTGANVKLALNALLTATKPALLTAALTDTNQTITPSTTTSEWTAADALFTAGRTCTIDPSSMDTGQNAVLSIGAQTFALQVIDSVTAAVIFTFPGDGVRRANTFTKNYGGAVSAGGPINIGPF